MNAALRRILIRGRVNEQQLRRPTMRRARLRWPDLPLNQRAGTETRAGRCSSFNRSKGSRKSKLNGRNVLNARLNSPRVSA
jgi:hypothetical protein